MAKYTESSFRDYYFLTSLTAYFSLFYWQNLFVCRSCLIRLSVVFYSVFYSSAIRQTNKTQPKDE
ncbi:hypothetical protein HMPREF1981_01584 [Bacteroides pyogenes F0041]|uniref:Uncharacterized protein n=1 Tax=Bacteroides pyogenes F0041 TaxID=1321819 RepID=U2CLY8_9BACE|nr:hypothetical protein HMPREF1981_01584 [Bacteroides pyogenes F0041]